MAMQGKQSREKSSAPDDPVRDVNVSALPSSAMTAAFCRIEISSGIDSV